MDDDLNRCLGRIEETGNGLEYDCWHEYTDELVGCEECIFQPAGAGRLDPRYPIEPQRKNLTKQEGE